MNLQDSVLFITGANRGLGLAFAQEALRRGARKVYAGVRTLTGVATPGIVEVRLDVTDAASVRAAAALCGDTTLLINNAGIVRLNGSAVEAAMFELSREMFETNYYGMIRVSQAFAPILAGNGGGAIINVLSDATWFARPMLTAYSASKSAAWAFTNALRIELRAQQTAVQGLHISFMDTDMTHGLDIRKTSPAVVAQAALDGVARGQEEVLADEFTAAAKRGLGGADAIYFNPPAIV